MSSQKCGRNPEKAQNRPQAKTTRAGYVHQSNPSIWETKILFSDSKNKTPRIFYWELAWDNCERWQKAPASQKGVLFFAGEGVEESVLPMGQKGLSLLHPFSLRYQY